MNDGSLDVAYAQQVGRRLIVFRKHIKFTQAELADRLGVTRRAIQKWEKGMTLPNAQYLFEMQKLALNINWLLSGNGAMLGFADKTEHELQDVSPVRQMCLLWLDTMLNDCKTNDEQLSILDSLYKAHPKQKNS